VTLHSRTLARCSRLAALLVLLLIPQPGRAQEPELPPQLDLLDAKLQRARAQAQFEVEQRATSAKLPKSSASALYQLAWGYLDPSGGPPNYAESLHLFLATITASKAGESGPGAMAKELRRNARRDLVRAYVHVGTAAQAWALFEQVGNGPGPDEQDARRMLELLAVEYLADDQYSESSAVYKKLQALYPDDAMICAWQVKIVVNSLALDDVDLQWRESELLGQYNERMLLADNYPKPLVWRCSDATQSMMRQMAETWAAEAWPYRDPATRQRAKQAYQRYLAQFPFGSYAEQYAYAQLLWRSHDFSEAYEQFVITLDLDPEGEFAIAAAWWAVLAMKNHLRYREPPVVTKACAVDSRGACAKRLNYSPSEYSADDLQMIAAYDLFAKYVDDPEIPELRDILLQRARIAIHHNRFDEAEVVLVRLIDELGVVDRESVAALLDVMVVQWLQAGDDPQRVLATGDALDARLNVFGDSDGLLRGVAWRRALAHRAAGDFRKCAAQFVELHDRFPEHSDAPATLWNAAECLTDDSRGVETARMLETLLTRYPDSEHARDAMLRLADVHQAIAHPEHAARHYETFAEGHADDERADDALENAYLLRLGLGQTEQAQADLRRFERLYRRSDVRRAARLFWSQHELLDSDEARRNHALEYLQSYGRKGGRDREMVAEAVIGQIDWRRSCPEPLLHDSCITMKRKPARERLIYAYLYEQSERDERERWRVHHRYRPPKSCGTATQSLVIVHSRDPKLSAAAQARFARVLALARKAEPPADDPERVADFRWALGMATVYMADQKFEEWLHFEVPEELDFFVEDWRRDSGARSWEHKYLLQVQKREDSNARLTRFIAHETRLAEELQARYAEVDATHSAAWMLAAAARMAAISQLFADQLSRTPVPQTFDHPDQVRVYCDVFAEHAEPIREQAIAAYQACLARSTERQHSNEFSRMCEDELQQLDEILSPATHELFGEPAVTSSRIEPTELVAEP
jgi:TolA-binding protein